MASENLEYICTQCWHSFEIEEGHDTDADIVCPKCDAIQPRANTEATEITESPEEEPDAPAQEPSPEAEEPQEEAESGGDPLEGLEAAQCTWRLRSAIGLTYNFHGINALQSWCAGKKGLDGMEVSIEETGIWRNLDAFQGLLRKHDPIDAFRVLGGEEIAPSAEKDPKRSSKESAEPEKDSEKKKPKKKKSESKPSKSRSSSSSGEEKDRTDTKRPSIRSTGEFTFRVGDSAPQTNQAWLAGTGGFLIGMLLILALWYFGILDMLPFGPLE